MVVNVTKIFETMKSKSFWSIGKNSIDKEKMLYYNYKKAF